MTDSGSMTNPSEAIVETPLVLDIGSLVERMDAQIEKWDEDEPRQDWWGEQSLFLQARNILAVVNEGPPVLAVSDPSMQQAATPAAPVQQYEDCPVCKGSGFSGYGSGYDAVCGECGGQRQLPVQDDDAKRIALDVEPGSYFQAMKAASDRIAELESEIARLTPIAPVQDDDALRDLSTELTEVANILNVRGDFDLRDAALEARTLLTPDRVTPLVEASSRCEQYEAALRWIYENGMKPDRPDWVGWALDKAYEPVRKERERREGTPDA